MLNEIKVNNLIQGYKLTNSPLYVLCFFLKMNKRFLVMINGADEKNNTESFKIENIVPNSSIANEIKANEKTIRLVGEDKPGIFLQKTNNAMYKATKQIIELLEENRQRIPETFYERNVLYAQESISVFYEIYINRAGIDDAKLRMFLEEKSTTLWNLYLRIAVGIPNCFYLSNDSINRLQKAGNQLTDYADRLKRDLGSY
jgi:hypothetical protein